MVFSKERFSPNKKATRLGGSISKLLLGYFGIRFVTKCSQQKHKGQEPKAGFPHIRPRLRHFLFWVVWNG
jgi:hypothetical protein